MHVRLRRYDELTVGEVRCWAEWQQADPNLHSPYFRPEFTDAVASVRDDVEVAVVEDGRAPAGFLPFQRMPGGHALPVGGPLSNFQGLVGPTDADWVLRDVLRAAGLKSYRFDQLAPGQQAFQAGRWAVNASYYLDLSNGFEAYLAARRAAGGRRVRETGRKTRKLAREVGPLRLELHTSASWPLQRLMELKSRQFRRSSLIDVFQFEWTGALLQRLAERTDDACRGLTTVLWAGEHPVAMAYSLRSFETLHCWFTSYEPAFAVYSPGMVQMLELARVAAEDGVTRLVLGMGDEPYKQSLASGSVPVCWGCCDVRFGRSRLGREWCRARQLVKRSPLHEPLVTPVRVLRSIKDRRWYR